MAHWVLPVLVALPSRESSVVINHHVFDGSSDPETVAPVRGGGRGHPVSDGWSHPWRLVPPFAVEPSCVVSSWPPCAVSFSSPSLANISVVARPFVLDLPLLQTCGAVVAGASNMLQRQQLPPSLGLHRPRPLGDGGRGHSVVVAYRSLELKGMVGSLLVHQVPFRLLSLPLSAAAAAFDGAWQACADDT